MGDAALTAVQQCACVRTLLEASPHLCAAADLNEKLHQVWIGVESTSCPLPEIVRGEESKHLHTLVSDVKRLRKILQQLEAQVDLLRRIEAGACSGKMAAERLPNEIMHMLEQLEVLAQSGLSSAEDISRQLEQDQHMFKATSNVLAWGRQGLNMSRAFQD